MIQVIQKGPSLASLSGQMIGQGLGKGLGDIYGNHLAQKSLESILNNPELQNASPSERLQALTTGMARHGPKGQQILQNAFMAEQQRMQEQESGILQKVIEGKNVSENELKKLSPQNFLKAIDAKKKKQFAKNVYDSLVNSGYPEETAQLWQNQMENAPVGGQSDVIRNVNDLIRRSKSGKGLGGEKQIQEQAKPNIEIPGVELNNLDLDFPDLPEPIGMTPSDIVKQNEYREKTNIPIYTETVDRLNALDDEYREIQHLQQLNEIPNALPTGIEKWNVDWESGDLRVKALASPESQDYVKTIARMARRAKDFFPGRVTNFDLDQFKQGFPTLANSPEGRNLIAQQLSLGNRIAYLKDETYKAAVDHYGSGADPVLIKKYATQNYRKLKSQLEDQLKQVNNQARTMINQENKNQNRPSLDEIFK